MTDGGEAQHAAVDVLEHGTFISAIAVQLVEVYMPFEHSPGSLEASAGAEFYCFRKSPEVPLAYASLHSVAVRIAATLLLQLAEGPVERVHAASERCRNLACAKAAPGPQLTKARQRSIDERWVSYGA